MFPRFFRQAASRRGHVPTCAFESVAGGQAKGKQRHENEQGFLPHDNFLSSTFSRPKALRAKTASAAMAFAAIGGARILS
jgi:hypothetical protein